MKCRKSTKTTPGAPKNDPKTTPRRPKKRSRTTRRQKNRTKTISRPSWIGFKGPNPSLVSPQGLHLGGQNGTKIDPKTIKNRSEKSRVKKTDPRRSWARLGAILGRLGCHLGALETLWHYACRCFVNIHFFDVKTVRRRLWDQLWPTKAPKRPKMTPKTEPKSTPRRSKIDFEIDMKNDTKTKRACPFLGRGVWVGTPPSGQLPGGAPGTPRSRQRLAPGIHVCVLNKKQS